MISIYIFDRARIKLNFQHFLNTSVVRIQFIIYKYENKTAVKCVLKFYTELL